MDRERWGQLVDAQHGVVTAQQAASHGITAAMIDRRVNDGIYQRLGPRAIGLFAATPGLPAIEVAAILNNPGAALSHFSAARRHGLDCPDDGLGHIVVRVKGRPRSGARPRSTEQLKVHRARHLGDHDVTTRRGLAVTSLERTIVDLFEVLKRRDDRRKLIAEAFRKRRTTTARISAAIVRIPQLKRRAELIYTIDLAAGGSHSAGEMRLYEFMAEWDLPEPKRQHIPQLPKGRRYVDCALPTYKIALEYDGQLHLSDDQKHDDIMRDQLLRRLGWLTIRVTELRMRDEQQLATDIWADICERAAALGVECPPEPPWRAGEPVAPAG